MKRLPLAAILTTAFAAVFATSLGWASPSPAVPDDDATDEPGVVVLAWPSGGALDLAVGDRLLRWAGTQAADPETTVDRPIDHPFDFAELWVLAEGLDSPTLEVERDGRSVEVAWPRGDGSFAAWPAGATLGVPDGARPLGARPLDAAWRRLETARAATRRGDDASAAWDEAEGRLEGRPDLAALVLLERGAAAVEAWRLEEAAATYRRAVEALEETGRLDDLVLAAALHELGATHLRRGRPFEALAPIERAVAIRRTRAPDGSALRRSLNNLSLALTDHGRFAEAQAALEEALVILREHETSVWHRASPDRRRDAELAEARLLNNLSTLAFERGDMVAAEEHARAAHALRARLAPDSLDLARSLNNLAIVLDARGEVERAEVWMRRALELRRRLGAEPREIVSSLMNLASLAVEASAYEEALPPAREAVVLAETVGLSEAVGLAEERRPEAEPVDGETRSWAHKMLAYALLAPNASSDDLTEAVAAARRSVDVGRGSVSDVVLGDALGVLGEAQMRSGALEAAEVSLREARELRSRSVPGSRWEAESRAALARLEARRGDLEAALDHQREAIDLLEATSGLPGETPRERARAAASTVDWYRRAASWLVALDRVDEAFSITERSRARGLLATLAERRLRFDRDLPAAVEATRQRLAAEHETLWRQLASVESAAGSADEILAVRSRLTTLLDERQALERRIRQLSPRLASLRHPEPVDAAEAVAQSPPGLLLLSWVVGPEESLLLALGPARAGGQAQLTAHRLPVGRDALGRRVDVLRAMLESESSEAQPVRERVARRLWRDLLGPVEERLGAADRLILVADDALLRLPFAALVDPSGRTLLERLPLARAASATVGLRHRWRAASVDRPLVAFGDPSPADPLAWSRREISSIADAHPGPSRTFVGVEARESAFKSLGGEVGWLHFAGHTEIADRFPLESYLRLSESQGAGHGGDSGRLHAWEIFESLRLDAELVTLSSCRSAGGREIDGEGLFGLAQAFLFAGARGVVASQWNVRDRPTALLMESFYRHLRAGSPVDEALRSAQLELRRGELDGGWIERWIDRALRWVSLQPARGDESASVAEWAAFELTLGAVAPGEDR